MKRNLLFILIIVLAVVALLYFTITGSRRDDVTIVQMWEMPEILVEISGIAYMGNNRMACIQDEDGIIFIFNLDLAALEKRIEFGPPGDYESITLVDDTAYVLRSDGSIFEVPNFDETPGETIIHTSDISSKYDFEGLAYDPSQHRLLLAPKETLNKSYIPVFAFDLTSATLEKAPAFRIFFSDTIFHDVMGSRGIRPSEISIHPTSGEIYILEGVNPKLLVLEPRGTLHKLIQLNTKQFNQAEGITFGDKGEIYISNEGNGMPGNILEVKLDL